MSATVGQPPDGWDGASGNWVYETLSTDGTALSKTEAEWRGALVAGAYHEIDSNVSGWSYSYQDPDGTVQIGGGSLFDYSPEQAPTSASDAAISSDIKSRSATNGVTVTDVSFLDARQPAPEITISTQDPKGFIDNPPSLASVVGSSVDAYEGFSITVVDSSGRTVEYSGFVPATGLSVAWRDPRYGVAGHMSATSPSLTCTDASTC